ncbi:hypothetical protein DXG01_004987 [Tephrocybe rancida]|nr:hypothetical protein DXG01_004987 [Tephrocybe rancida]
MKQAPPCPQDHRPSDSEPRSKRSKGMFPPSTISSRMHMRTDQSSSSADPDASVQQTDTDAALARLSAVQKEYLSDPFIRAFVPRAHLQAPRPPLINVGTYVRATAVDLLVDGWLESTRKTGGRAQIVSLGAGSDTRFWRVATGKYADVLESYVEIDFAEVTGKKAMAIRKSKELSKVLGESVQVAQGGTVLHSPKYHLLAADLRLPPSTTLGDLLASGSGDSILSPSLPTLLLFECVLVYMEPSSSEAILRWFVDYFLPAGTPLGGVVYEMFNLEDSFGKVMVNNLKARGVSLPGAAPFPTLATLPRRFLDVGFTAARAVTLREIRKGCIAPEELERISALEMLDEVEELELVLEHYAVTWGLMVAQRIDAWNGWGLGKFSTRYREEEERVREKIRMSKSATASATKPQLSQRSAWSKGPPQNTAPSPRSQSPAPSAPTPAHQTHSRRSSTLGQGVPIKDGVTIPRSNATAIKAGKSRSIRHICSAVTFGSIDDDSAPISSSPAAAPPIKSEGVKSFGSVPATAAPPGHVNGKPSVSSRPPLATPAVASSSSSSTPPPATPFKPAKMDIHKLFQNPSSAPSSTPSDTSSPSLRPVTLPNQSSSQHAPSQAPPQQPSQLGPSYQTFVPGGGRPHQNSGQRVPSSPIYARQMPNGNGARPQAGPNGGSSQIPSGLASPRMAPHPHQGPPSGMPPPNMQPPMQQQMPYGWPSYYYAGAPEQHYGYWYSPGSQMQGPPPPQHPHQPPHPGPHGLPHNGMPMSPRSQPPSLQPGTPTQQHALPSNIHTPHPAPPPSHSHSANNSISSFTSPPSTPSTATTRLNAASSAFIPGSRSSSKVTLKNPDGLEININTITKTPVSASVASASPSPGPRSGFNNRQPSPSSPAMTPNRRPTSVRLESEEQRQKRLAEEKKKEEESNKAKAEAEEKVRKEKEEKERKEREEKERKLKEEEEKERERVRKEEEEKERIRKEEEAEKERLRKEEEEKARLLKEEEERKLKEEEEEKERVKEAEEVERLVKEAEAEKERVRLEEEAAAKAKADAEAAAAVVSEPEAVTPEAIEEEEEGQVVEFKSEESPSVETPKDKAREALRINTATPSAVDHAKRPRPGALDLSDAKITNDAVPLAPPTALALANPIKDFDAVPYPEGIQSPDPNVTRNNPNGLLRYGRDFLLQFMDHCKEKPEGLQNLDTIGLDPNGNHGVENVPMSRGGSGRHRNVSGVVPPSRQASLGLGLGNIGFGKGGVANPFSMGNFSSTGSKLSNSEDRFAAATRAVSVGGAGAFGGRPSPMQRSSSQGGVGGTPMSSNRTRSKRGEKRGEGNKAGQQHGGYGHNQSNMSQSLSMEPVAPLQVSANRWDRKTIVTEDSTVLVDRKVKALLNKLTMEKFDSISDQIVSWANKSEEENDGMTLIQVIRLVFEKATDEATWSEMYARLCRKMMERIIPTVRDEGIVSSDGKPITGGQLFRKYLLNRCQEEFEHGWLMEQAAAAAAASKAAEDQAIKEAAQKSGSTETALYSDEYYAAQKAKRRGLGLIRFIGELFKLQMLTERIMHECLKKLLGNVDTPEEEDIESCCGLMKTVGSMLDTPRAAKHMGVYFARITELRNSPLVNSRIRFLLQDVIELRERKWVNRNIVAVPATIAQIHENAAKEKAAAEKDSFNRQISMSRGGSRRGGDRGDLPQVGPDGWAVAGGNGPPRPPPKAGDLSSFGKITKNTTMTFGPSSVFAGKKGAENKRESVSRSSSSSNMFSMLSQGTEPAAETKEPEPQRKRLVLAPRSKPAADDVAAKSESEVESEAEPAEPTLEMTEEQANQKVAEDTKEFFAIHNLEEAELYFTALPPVHHFRLIEKLTSRAIEAKESFVQLLAEFFARVVEKQLSSPAAFEQGFMPIAELIDDITIDAPKAFTSLATVVKSAGLDEESKGRLAAKSLDDTKFLELIS